MKYYKITNEEEIHNRLQYKTGLNIDPIPFNPHGNCELGGIYFSREDILAFLCYGSWLREVTLPEDAQVYENPYAPKKWKANKVILGERERITVDVVKRLIDEGADPKAYDSSSLVQVADKGRTDIVKLLIPVSDPMAYDSAALRQAASKGHTDIVKLLIPVSDPRAYNSQALRQAANEGHTDIVKLLIPVSDPKANNSQALRTAAYRGHTDTVKILIPVSDPEANNSQALRWATDKGYTDIVKLLKPIS